MNLKRIFAVLLIFVLFVSSCACGSDSDNRCGNCGAEHELDDIYCSECGYSFTDSFADSKPVCSRGHENEVGAVFCAVCGLRLTGVD